MTAAARFILVFATAFAGVVYAQAPSRPEVTVTGVTHNSITLSWTIPPGGGTITGYTLRRNTPNVDGDTDPPPVELPSSATTYTDTGLENGVRYQYLLTAMGASGNTIALPAGATTMQTATASGAAADEAILPRVLPQIHRSVLERIKQRQTQDGRWK